MCAAPAPYDRLEPVTIVPDRYSGTYSGGQWLAFPLPPSAVPADPFGTDTVAAAWWAGVAGLPVGRGDTPDTAHADLVARLEAIQPTNRYPAYSKTGGEMWSWELQWPSGDLSIVDRSWRGAGRGPHR